MTALFDDGGETSMLSSEQPHALLVRPWIEDFSAFDLWMRPLGLLRLATILRRLNVNVALLDCLDRYSPLLEGLPAPNRHRLNRFDCGHLHRKDIETPEILKRIPRRFKRYGVPKNRIESWLRTCKKPDVVFVVCMTTYWYTGAQRMIRQLKTIWPETPVILGGVYPLLCPDHACEFSGADAVVTKPGWRPGVLAAAPYLDSPDPSEIDKAVKEPVEIAYDLLNSRRSIPLLTRSGCPFRCSYCASVHIDPESVAFPTDWALDLLESGLNDEGVTDVAFFDDALLFHPDRYAKPLFEGIIRRNLPVRLHTPNALHARFIDKEMAVLMRRAGMRTVRLGFESDDPDFQRSSGGKVTTDEFGQALEYLREAGFPPHHIGTYILAGLPGQDLRALKQAAMTVHQNGSQINFAMYAPTPRTSLFEKKEGFAFDAAEDPLLQNDSLTPWRSTLYTDQKFREIKVWADRLNQLLRLNAKSD